MPANCPPEETFDVVTPGQVVDEIKANDVQIQAFNLQVRAAVASHLRGSDEYGNLVYDPGWAEFDVQYQTWFRGWEQFRDAHDEWLENFPETLAPVRINEQYKCQLIDWIARFEELEKKKYAGPRPKFTEPAKGVTGAAESLTKLALVGIGAYLVVGWLQRNKTT
jgi:hypothetical protein